MKRKEQGFTLMELVITLIIVITLSLISWPIYRGRHREYSVLAEGYALLGTIIEAQINYYNEYGNFVSPIHSINQSALQYAWTFHDPVLGINCVNNRYFSIFNAYDALKTNGGGVNVNHKPTEFTVGVRSAKAGTIIQKFNLTERNEPVVTGAKNVTFF